MTWTYREGKCMLWIRASNGDWLNLERCDAITVWSESDKFKIKVKIGNEDYVWKKFDTQERAQFYLDEQMQILTGN